MATTARHVAQAAQRAKVCAPGHTPAVLQRCISRAGQPARAPCRWYPTDAPGGRAHVAARAAKDENNELVASAIKIADDALNTASGFVPESVPRSVAKGGLALLGGLIVFSIVQKVLSGVITLALLLGGGYLWLQSQSKADAPKDGAAPSDDSSDPLSEARRIMDKYK